MPFPISLSPTSRTFEAGDYPIKRFTSQSGVETRILYGSRRTGQKMSLTYQNIFDYEAEQFVDHYDEVFGTLNAFSIASAGTSNGGKAGWNGVATAGSFSSQGYQVRVSPASLVEGDTFDVFFDGPASAATAGLHYWEVTGVQADDFERLIGSSYPSINLTGSTSMLTSGTRLPGFPTGASASNNQARADGSVEGVEVMVLSLYSDSARTNLLASINVPIADSGTGQKASSKTIGAGAYSSGWRYEGPPQLTQVRPGISTVTVNLVAVL